MADQTCVQGREAQSLSFATNIQNSKPDIKYSKMKSPPKYSLGVKMHWPRFRLWSSAQTDSRNEATGFYSQDHHPKYELLERKHLETKWNFSSGKNN
jgi:hypothetical protein